MKKLNFVLFYLFIFIVNAFTQDYNLSAPIGYGAGTTGGAGGSVTTVTTASALSTALGSSGSKIIIVSGSISTSRISRTITNKTLIGLAGAKLINLDQTKDGSGILNLKSGSSNVIIRNLTFEGPGAYDTNGKDLLSNEGCSKLWVDHCEFQDGVDGNFDNTNDADNVTVSWCKFTYLKTPRAGGSGGTDDHRFTNLVGGSDSGSPSDGKYSITWHYCWWTDGCVERMTRARNAQLHFLNCYWDSSNAKVLLGLGGVTDCYVENSTFSATGNKYKYYDNGTVRLTCSGCTSPPSNVGTCPAPSYSYTPLTGTGTVSAVTNTSCGAGATLLVNATTGETSSACASPILTMLLGPSSQSISLGDAMSVIIYMYDGSATGAIVTGLPSGANFTVNPANKTIVITGTPTALGVSNFTVTTTQSSGTAVSLGGALDVNNLITLDTPNSISESHNESSVTLSWPAIANANNYTINWCAPGAGPTLVDEWDFTGTWSISATDADANLEEDETAGRFNYIPATTDAALVFEGGSPIPDVAGLLFTQNGSTKIRLGYNKQQLYLNGSNISVSIPCQVGTTVTIVGPAGNSLATDRGYSAVGGTLVPASCINVNASGILTEAGEVGTWVYTATSTTLRITTETGGMNVQSIKVETAGGGTTCTEIPISSTSHTITGLINGSTYTYQVKATSTDPNYIESAYTTAQSATTGTATICCNTSIDFTIRQSDNEITINGIKVENIKLLSTQGTIVVQSTGNQPVNISSLSQGIYILTVSSKEGTACKKIMIR